MYKAQAQAAVSRQQCARVRKPGTARVVASAHLGGWLQRLFRGGSGDIADIEEIRRLPPLPDTADELCDVANRLGVPESEILLGSRATETALKSLSERRQLKQYRVLHLATHGALTRQVGSVPEPGLILTPPPKGTTDPTKLRRDDGFLSASEIAALDLDADWAILSACNTAAGANETAEPLSGLARAFIFAGARALLVSHWEVDSRATVRLVTGVFAELKADPKIGRAEALRRSMRRLIAEGLPQDVHPALWAPFVLVGNGAGSIESRM